MPSKDSKTNFALLRDKILQKSGKDYWRSVEEFADAPEFEEFARAEYPQQAEEWEDGLSRRNFIKVMGASLALAGLSGCVIQPAEKIVPYVSQPEEIIPGKPLFYATAMTIRGEATGLLAKSNEGRPTKIEGNPEHPQSLGATDVLAQASLLNMYDPDRSQEITYRGNSTTWQNFMSQIRAGIDENRVDGGAGVRFLTETVTSPTMIAQMRQILTELPNARWYQYEPVNCDNATAGAKMSFGSPAKAIYKFDQATRILSLDKDIFSDFNVRYTKDFNKSRLYNHEKTDINRLYAIETTMTLTGAKADHRLAVKPSQMPEIAKAIAAALGVSGATSTYTENAQWIQAMARDLQANRGKSIVVAGDNQPPMIHALANAMNAALGNVGTTVTYVEPFQPFADVLQIDQLRQLITEIDGGAVKMLVILGGNPVYNTPSDLKLNAERMNKIPLRVHLGHYFDETGELCQWHISEKHYLEMWSDTRAFDGTVSIVQPLIQPLYDGKSAHEVVQVFFRENYDKKDFDIVKEYWQRQGFAGAPRAAAATANNQTRTGNQTTATSNTAQTQTGTLRQNQDTATTAASTQNPAANPTGGSVSPTGKSFDDAWRKVVHDGFVPNTAATAKSVAINSGFMSQPSTPMVSGNLEISILPDPSIYDGRFANNGWLQELPNPLTKITWENVALVSPNTAKRLEVNQAVDENEYVGGSQGSTFINTKGGNLFSDLVTLKMNGAEVGKSVPMWIAPGQPDDVITIYLGYGRTRAGRIGTGIGYNAYNVQRSDAMWSGAGEVAKTGGQTAIASTQIHFNMEGRDILRVWDLEHFNNTPDLGHQHDHYPDSMYPRYEYTGNKWGMTVDLNSCVGCNACVIACQSENNIPVVGREQVERSREMHWMRIDAYYSGEVENPDGPYFQPMLCQQCELAPCETVCPVHATVHSAEGLNDMVYNRCIGTRYCSNNCPYKVRRFNFLLYQDWETPQYKLMRNPEVTIRSRGVMEKCTYCTQRIASARIEAEKDGRRMRDGEIVTACQSVCPADAIVFGDLNDPNSQVAKLKKDHRNYNVLNDLNTQPRTTYLAGLKNQNKEMPDYRTPEVKDSEHKTGEQKTGDISH
ncbi:MAG: TAT-variant-translocated molybdopterin oxidoreductase [Acidobacteria bacterium]|jgi:molybdopterin-containing oxidoreductase family iron-sulfur binding subunit|nr:TAT-variant-translocated molybdopterin oxidoreductase [Acidobacteriota bacterium]